ncbi:MAG: hypothetical protein U1F87_04805 [Kiritimatiellia bacterium]
MNIDHFFKNWGIDQNPFRAEEARDDELYQRIMGDEMTHPEFEKIMGTFERPGTAVVFGEKGSGKTAIRLLIEERIRRHNAANPERMAWVIAYDDLNPFLDHLSRHASQTRHGKPAEFPGIRLADHQDNLLVIATTKLVDLLNGDDETDVSARRARKSVRRMSRQKRVDLAELALLYDLPSRSSQETRWHGLRRLLRVGSVFNQAVCFWMGVVGTGLAAASLAVHALMKKEPAALISTIFFGLLAIYAGFRWITQAVRTRSLSRKVAREIRVVPRPAAMIARRLGELAASDLATQPVPVPGDQDSRYDLMTRLIRILEECGYASVYVLMDRADEPARVNGDARRMREIVWPMLNNKFLQQERMGFKLLLPIELGYLVKKEEPAFFQQARLDKQNMVERLEWTGPTLYDICTKRLLSAAGAEAKVKKLTDLFEPDVTPGDLIDALDQMHQPRDAFKFLYQVFLEHCKNTPDDLARFTVPKLVLEQIRKQQSQRVKELYRGLTPA